MLARPCQLFGQPCAERSGQGEAHGFKRRGQNLASRSCCSARTACRRSRTVFLSAPPCFHGLHRPHADDLRALMRRWVSLVFMGAGNDEPLRRPALALGDAAFVHGPQMPPPFRRGGQCVLAGVGHRGRVLFADQGFTFKPSAAASLRWLVSRIRPRRPVQQRASRQLPWWRTRGRPKWPSTAP